MPAAAWLEIPDFAVRFAAACLSGTFKYLFLIILLIKAKSDMLIAAVPFIFRIPDQIRDYTYKSYCGRDRPESSEVPRRSAGSEQSPADVKSGSGRRPPDP